MTDEAGKPLQGAKLVVHSSSVNYYARFEGAFAIELLRRPDTVTVSFDGYLKQQVRIGNEQVLQIRLKKAEGARSSRAFRLASLTKDLKRETQQQWFTGDETYASIVENQFINATAYPATGLSLNVDRASYSNIRRFLLMNTIVPPDAVRIEEMLNYFNFEYREPEANQPFRMEASLTQCPWNPANQLLFAQIHSKRIHVDSLPPSHLVFLIDVSGSMDMPNRLPILKGGFKALVNNLREKDSVSIVIYGGGVGVALPTTSGADKSLIFKAIDSIQPGGSTPGESGIKLAYSMARQHLIKGGNNRVILATDGDFNVGINKEEELQDLIASQREVGIYLTCLGVGMGNYKDSKIQALAQQGNGNFAYIDSYAEAEKILLREFAQTLFTVADDAYLNVQFHPDYVKEYRLLGFDNKVGAIKDREATVEGGEIGSANSILVAFEITPTLAGMKAAAERTSFKPVQFDLQYNLPGDTGEKRMESSPEMRFASLDSTADHFRFAAAVVMMGGMLRHSKFFKDVNWNDIHHLAENSAREDSYSQQEFLQLVNAAKSVYGRKRKKGS